MREIRQFNKLKKIVNGEMWGMNDTCTKDNFYKILLKLKVNEIWGKWEVLKLYKREEGGGSRGSVFSVMLCCRICDLNDYLWGVGTSQLGYEW